MTDWDAGVLPPDHANTPPLAILPRKGEVAPKVTEGEDAQRR